MLFLTGQNPSFALYDVVKAKTIQNENEIVNEQIEEHEIDEFDYELTEYDPDKDVCLKISKKIKKIFKIKDKPQSSEIIQEENTEKNELDSYAKYSENYSVDDENKFKINADKVTYNDEEGSVLAKGNVEIIAPSKKVILKANEALLDKTQQTIKLLGAVKIIKKDVEMCGEYLLIDLNEQNVLMDNPVLNTYSFAITAQEGFLIENDIQMLHGQMKSVRQSDFPIVTRGFMRYDNIDRGFFAKENSADYDLDVDAKRQTYRIDAKEIVITSYKDHNSVLLKDADIFYNNHKIAKKADLEIISDKPKQVKELTSPEAGNFRGFGSYVGYGWAMKAPMGHTFKFMPVLAYYDSNVGVGAIGRYRSPNHLAEAGWNSASENWAVRGRYNLGRGLQFTYGRHAYIPEGFMGARRSGYAGQLHFQKSYRIPDLDASFSNGIYAGVFSDYSKEDQEDAYSTTRFRYMATFSKSLYKYKSKDNDFALQLKASTQGAATVYGSGENHGIIRFGPTLTTKFKRWEQTIAYYMSGTHGETPFDFDRYRYGKSTIQMSEKFKFNDKLAVGLRLFITPMKDNYQEDLFTETRLFVMFGPRDAKVAFSYDFVRDVSHLDFMFLIGSDNTAINFDKLTTKDIDGKQEKRDFYKNIKRVVIDDPKNL